MKKNKNKQSNPEDLGFGITIIVSMLIFWCLIALIYRVFFV